MNPVKNMILERLGTINDVLEPLTNLCERYLHHVSAVDTTDGTLLIGHQPWRGSDAYG